VFPWGTAGVNSDEVRATKVESASIYPEISPLCDFRVNNCRDTCIFAISVMVIDSNAWYCASLNLMLLFFMGVSLSLPPLPLMTRRLPSPALAEVE
jgi:hypothetical protein